jgi:hypothetical protein
MKTKTTREVDMTESPMWLDCGATCVKCGERLIAPEWSEFVTERLILNLWACTSCGDRFETPACTAVPGEPANTATLIETVFPLPA